jgi:hypothetical protein
MRRPETPRTALRPTLRRGPASRMRSIKRPPRLRHDATRVDAWSQPADVGAGCMFRVSVRA